MQGEFESVASHATEMIGVVRSPLTYGGDCASEDEEEGQQGNGIAAEKAELRGGAPRWVSEGIVPDR